MGSCQLFVLVGSYISVRMPRCFDDVIVKFSLVIRLIIVRDRGIVGGLICVLLQPPVPTFLLVSESVIDSLLWFSSSIRVSVNANPFIHIHYDCFANNLPSSYS